MAWHKISQVVECSTADAKVRAGDLSNTRRIVKVEPTKLLILIAALAFVAHAATGDEAVQLPPEPDATEDRVDPIEAAFNRFVRLKDEGRMEESAAAALQVAQLSQDRYGEDSIEVATPLINLAVMQSQTGDLVAAEQNYRAAISLIERHEGMLSARLINPLSGLGHTYNRAGMYDQAITSFDRALRLNHIERGFTNFKQFSIQDGLTESYVGLREYEDANFYQESQLEIYQRKFGPEDPQVVPAMYKLAEWYNRTGNIEESALTYRGADRILRESQGELSPERADALLGLARLYERQGNRPAAASTLRKAVKLLEKSPEADALRRAEVRVALGDLYTRESRFGSANGEYTAAWSDLSGGDEYLDRRDYYFKLPVRLGGGPFPKLARNARGRTAPELRNGYVEIRYTVDQEGTAQDVVVIESEPRDVMEASLLSIYSRSVYRPRYVDGAPTVTENLLSRHEFRYAVQVVTEEQDAKDLPRPESKRGRIDYPGAADED